MAWSGVEADAYVRSDQERPKPESLALISTYLRSDKNLSPEAATALDELVKAPTSDYGSRREDAMGFRRGFKTEANELTAEIRKELGLSLFDQLDPHKLAAWLEIPIIRLSEFLNQAPAVKHLLEVEQGVFSAVTVFAGPQRTIVHNDVHSSSRQSSNVTHELSHGLLLHPTTPALDDRGCRHWNQDIEDEANWLAGALLVPEAAAMAIAKGRWAPADAARRFGVSPPPSDAHNSGLFIPRRHRQETADRVVGHHSLQSLLDTKLDLFRS